MRHLFVPACICLMTWSSTTGTEPKLSSTDFPGVSTVRKKEFARTTPAETSADLSESTRANIGLASSDDEALPEPVTIDIPPLDALPPAGLAQTVPVVLPPTAPLPPVPKPVVPRSRDEICDSLAQAAQKNDLPVPFFIRLLFQESRFKPGVVSTAGAQGIAQFMPDTAASRGVDNPFDPLQAIPASARLLRELFEQFGNLGLAAAAYNAGPKRIQDWLAKKGKLPEETQGYVKTITGRAAETWTAAEKGSPAVKLPRRAPCQEAAGLLAWNGPEHIPLPPTRSTATTAVAEVKKPSREHTKVAAAGPVKIAQHGSHMTAIIDTAKDKKDTSGRRGVKAKAGKGAKPAKGAVQLAASKQKHRKVRLSQK